MRLLTLVYRVGCLGPRVVRRNGRAVAVCRGGARDMDVAPAPHCSREAGDCFPACA